MRYTALFSVVFFASLFQWQGCSPKELSPSELRRHAEFSSVYVAPHSLDIYLPPGYVSHGRRRFPVVYIHDGQFLFYGDSTPWSGAWGIDSLMDTLITAGRIQPAIVVGIGSTDRRLLEYMPRKGVDNFPDSTKALFTSIYTAPESDQYLKFIVEEVKPFVDSIYRTKPEPASTFIVGSTMGGLISLYGITEYPEVFGGAGCIATHWILGEQDVFPDAARAMVDALGANLPDPANHKIYFDYWIQNEISISEPYQNRMDQHMGARGYRQPVNWVTNMLDTQELNMKAWKEQLHRPFEFLLGVK